MPLFQAIGAIGGAAINAGAISDASKQTAAGSAAALAEQKREYDAGVARQQPWLTTGASALNQLAKIYGLDTSTFNQGGGAAISGGGAAISNGGAAISGQSQNDAATLAQIRSGAQQWESAIPGNGAGIIQAIDSGASLQDVLARMQSLRTTTTNPQNTAFLDPLITQASSAAATSGAGVSSTFQPGTAAGGQPGAGPDYSAFYKSPDYQFRLDEGLKGLEARAATGAFGGRDSGALRKAEIGYSGNLAAGGFNDYANRMSALAGVGQTTATNQANQGQAYANQVGNIAQNAGNNRANASIYGGQNYANTVNQLAGAGQSYFQGLGGGGGNVAVNDWALPANNLSWGDVGFGS